MTPCSTGRLSPPDPAKPSSRPLISRACVATRHVISRFLRPVAHQLADMCRRSVVGSHWSIAFVRRRSISCAAAPLDALWGARSAWCCAISMTTDPPLCIPAAAALRADLQLPEKLRILVLHIGVMHMRRGQKLIRTGLGERATRLLRILHVKPYGGSWDTGRLATGHCGLQYPHLAAVKAGPFHHSAITKRPWHVAECTLLAGR